MMTLHRMSAGTGYEYLLKHVARGDVDQPALDGGSGPLESYYARSGYPPGVWMGKGLTQLEHPLLGGDEVTEMQLAQLLGEGRDPTSGAPLGRTFPTLAGLSERIESRVGKLDPELSAKDRSTAIESIQTEETARKAPVAVAGFDLTFSPAKSVTALWAVADPTTQKRIQVAHREALMDALDWLQDNAVFTRTGAGGVAQIDTHGVIAAAFDHHDTRSGDPQLHTHVVVANRVQGVDGKWRTLDSRVLHRAAVAASELYDTALADHLTAELGVDWEHRVREIGVTRDRESFSFEVAGVPPDLIAEFSSRSEQIRQNMDDLKRAFHQDHGRDPKGLEWIILKQRATLLDRPLKDAPESLAEATMRWRRRAEQVTGENPSVLVANVIGRRPNDPESLLAATDISADSIEDQAVLVVTATSLRRSTWTRWNLFAEAARQTRSVRFVSTEDRLQVLNAITDRAMAQSVSLDPPELLEVPAAMRRASGESIFTVSGEGRFSSRTILDAEDYLLSQATVNERAEVSEDAVEAAIAAGVDGHDLSPDQAAAVRAVATSGRGVDVLIGPAGTGKTTTLQALTDAWRTEHGEGSVIGLAPSAAAADVLADSIGIDCENTAKWLHETAGDGARTRRDRVQQLAAASRDITAKGGRLPARLTAELEKLRTEERRWNLRPNQLVIVDEASLGGTLSLAALARQAEASDAKLLLVGDHGQLTAVDAGGALGLLAHETGAVELSAVWRFRNDWERTASLQLRRGSKSALDAYEHHGRIHDGDRMEMLDAAYQAWLTDTREGKTSLLIAADNATVEALNSRARLDLIEAGIVAPEGVELTDGSEVSRGDRIVTRRNNRSLRAGDRWVRNGDIWTIEDHHEDGSLTVTRQSTDAPRRASVRLPAEYVREHVSLAYATTIHRSQGATVDTAHAIVTDSASREGAYVAATRGRDANHLYAVIDPSDDEHGHHITPATGRELLEAVLRHRGAELSATETIRQRYDAASSMPQLVAIYEHIAPDHPANPAPGEDWIAGLWPRREATDPAARPVLEQVEQLIDSTAAAAADKAIAAHEPWIDTLVGPIPDDTATRWSWYRTVVAAAAYRSRWNITTTDRLEEPDGSSDYARGHDRRRLYGALAAHQRASSHTPTRTRGPGDHDLAASRQRPDPHLGM